MASLPMKVSCHISEYWSFVVFRTPMSRSWETPSICPDQLPWRCGKACPHHKDTIFQLRPTWIQRPSWWQSSTLMNILVSDTAKISSWNSWHVSVNPWHFHCCVAQHFTPPDGNNISVEHRCAANAVQLGLWGKVSSCVCFTNAHEYFEGRSDQSVSE